MSDDFYQNIPEIKQFIGVIEDENFYSVPDDWVIVITDIANSTHAVSAGRYKDVNMVGGAAICAIRNVTDNREWPFVFGGDGATVLIDPLVVPEVKAALVRTRSLARDSFDLELRIGFVPVTDVRKQGVDLLVARYEVSAGNCFALFGGGGVELADSLVKADLHARTYRVPEYTLPGLPDLTGLSCRWESIVARKGRIVCLLIKPLANDFPDRQAILSIFLSKLADIIGPELDLASPVTEQSMRLRWPPKGLVSEAKATRGSKSLARRLCRILYQSLIQWVMNRFNLSAGGFDADAYRRELCTNSDHCKFDDVLRMVLDCAPDQVTKIRALLDTLYQTGDIEFGVFDTEEALITCLLFDLESSQHLHFVDGNNGGLWSASQGLKQQFSQQNGA